MRSAASILGLDVGTQRIGLAKAFWPSGIATPYGMVANDQGLSQNLIDIVSKDNVKLVVVGRPRGLSGQVTNQTLFVDSFVSTLKTYLDLPIYTQDEALTSHQAETELKARGKPYSRSDIDSLSATYILDDFMKERPKGVAVG